MDNAHMYTAVRRFADECPELKELEAILTNFNLFSLMGKSKLEDVHSRVLGWLLDPEGNHKLGDAFLVAFLQKSRAKAKELGIEFTHPTGIFADGGYGTEVTREWENEVDGSRGFLDILAINGKARSLLAVENKVESNEHTQQLTRYRKALENRYRDFGRVYVFLSPNGIKPEEPEERKLWIPLDYAAVADLVQTMIQERSDDMKPDVKMFLEHYKVAVRRQVLDDSQAKKLARDIYRQHRAAIKFINENKTGYAPDLQDILKQEIRAHAHGGWVLEEQKIQTQFTRFHPKEWTGLEILRNGTGWLPCPALLLLEFQGYADYPESLGLCLVIGPCSDERLRNELDSHLRKIPCLDGVRRVGGDWIIYHVSERILVQSDFDEWDEEKIRSKIKEWVAGFTERQYPELRDAVVQFYGQRA